MGYARLFFLIFLLLCGGCFLSQEVVVTDSLGRVVEIRYPDSTFVRFDNRVGYHWRSVYDRKGKLVLTTVERGVFLLRYEFVEPKKVEIVEEDSGTLCPDD